MVFRISRLALDHFRSWAHLVLDVQPGINVLVGKNGIGKTNIVEAIEFLSSGSSHRASASKYLVQRGETKATIRANVSHELTREVNATGSSVQENASEGTKRTLEVTIPLRGAIRSRVDSGPSRYFRDIAGQVKAVVFNPRDQQLVSGDPAQRRNFLDSTAIMMFPDYYPLLQRFRQIAKQRTAILKRLSEASHGGSGRNGGETLGFTDVGSQSIDQRMALTELEVWTSQFSDAGIEITQRRNEVIERLKEPFTRLYSELANGNGAAGLSYEPSFDEVFGGEELVLSESCLAPVSNQEMKQAIAQHFQRLYPGEVARGSNLIGPHRDDLLISLDGEPAREFASNGELWTLGLALKMAQFDYLSREDTPILILDDVFAQLDESRRHQILDFAAHQEQVFITVAAHSDIPEMEGSTIIDVESLAEASALDSPEALLADFQKSHQQ
jgi:DNA replication and repair protein RecF